MWARSILIAAAMWTVPATPSGATEVDLELVLAVDISRSMDAQERRLQRDGYVTAFRHPEVIRAIESGLIGRIAVTYFEWGGIGRNRVVVPWTIISNARDANAFADVLASDVPGQERGTSISSGLDLGLRLLDRSPARGLRRVIDVSGDGPNNMGPPVNAKRDEVVARGIVINGLPIVLRPGGPLGFFDIANLDHYYEDCVIGGPGAFLVTVNGASQFEIAIRRKLVLEIAGRDSRLMPVQLEVRELTDCLIGEKVRARRLRELRP